MRLERGLFFPGVPTGNGKPRFLAIASSLQILRTVFRPILVEAATRSKGLLYGWFGLFEDFSSSKYLFTLATTSCVWLVIALPRPIFGMLIEKDWLTMRRAKLFCNGGQRAAWTEADHVITWLETRKIIDQYPPFKTLGIFRQTDYMQCIRILRKFE